MSAGVVDPFLPPLTPGEIQEVLSAYPQGARLREVLTVSGRPYSAASLVRSDKGDFFIKKRLRTWRRLEDLEREHALIRHLRSKGFPTPQVHETRQGHSVYVTDDAYYELFDRALGRDLYRSYHSWMPFPNLAHARAAGRALAAFHRAVCDFPLQSPRPLTPMSAQVRLIASSDLIEGISNLAESLPALGRFLSHKPSWKEEVERAYRPFHARARELLLQTPGWTTHGDWHANNLFFDGDDVSDVVDFHLSDYTVRAYDLAVALDRNGIRRLQADELGLDAVHFDVMQAFLQGYLHEFPLSEADAELLPLLFPIHQLDLALTNMAYYEGDEGNRTRAEWVYEVYLIRHARWFQTPTGRKTLDFLTACLAP